MGRDITGVSMKIENFVWFRVDSTELSPGEILKIIGVPPTRSWAIGDFRPKTKLCGKTNGCIIESGLPTCASIEEHLSCLFDKVRPYFSNFKHLSAFATIELGCAIYAMSMPTVNLGSHVIRFLADINSSVDYDIYIVDESFFETP